MTGDTFLGLRSDDLAMVVLAALGALVLMTWLVSRYVCDALKTRQIQQTKREVVAYVAEGTISPEDAVRILTTDSSDLERQIGSAIASGLMSPKKAAKLLEAARMGRDVAVEAPAKA